MLVCMSSIEIQTAGQILVKMKRWSLRVGRFLGEGFDPLPPPPGYRVRKEGPGCLWSLNHAF